MSEQRLIAEYSNRDSSAARKYHMPGGELDWETLRYYQSAGYKVLRVVPRGMWYLEHPDRDRVLRLYYVPERPEGS